MNEKLTKYALELRQDGQDHTPVSPAWTILKGHLESHLKIPRGEITNCDLFRFAKVAGIQGLARLNNIGLKRATELYKEANSRLGE